MSDAELTERIGEDTITEPPPGTDPPPEPPPGSAPLPWRPQVVRRGSDAVPDVRIVTLDEFAAVDEPGAAAILGTDSGALIPEGGDVMVYGDGGVGKTALAADLGFHLAAGDAWLRIPVARAIRVLIVENEGPRPLFHRKLARKRDGWGGSELSDRLRGFEQPWGRFSFAIAKRRTRLQQAISRHFGLLADAPANLRNADRALLAAERRALMADSWDWPELQGVEPAKVAIEPWLPEKAMSEFLGRFHELR